MALSVVVPAFNEESTIADCLARLLAQGPVVSEIIVVDNNSTDGTADIVRAIAAENPTVRLTDEPTPGVTHARYAGFDEATADVIASVDADTVVRPGWAESIQAMFDEHPQVGAGGAPMTMHDLPWQKRYTALQQKMKRSAAAAADRGEPREMLAISGANSAIRASAWKLVRHRVSYRRDIFEDLDLSLHLKEAGHDVAMIAGMDATVSGRRAKSGPIDFLKYAACGPRTYLLHKKPGMAALTAATIVPELVRLLVMLPANRAWNHGEQRFSLTSLRAAKDEVRASPVGSRLD